MTDQLVLPGLPEIESPPREPARWENPRLPLWLRVALYATDHADHTGRLELAPRQLHEAIATDPSTEAKHISRAIYQAKKYGALGPGSTARHLHLSPTWGGEPS